MVDKFKLAIVIVIILEHNDIMYMANKKLPIALCSDNEEMRRELLEHNLTKITSNYLHQEGSTRDDYIDDTHVILFAPG